MARTIASGIPCAAYGFTEELGKKAAAENPVTKLCDIGGIGGTLAANALSMHAMKATLSEILNGRILCQELSRWPRFNDGSRA